MLKRKIAVLIAGGLLSVSAQVGLAVAQQGPFPMGAADSDYWKPQGPQAKYLEERAGPNPTGASRSLFSMGAADSDYWKPSPAQLKYFADREAKIGAKGVTAPGTTAFAEWHMQDYSW